MASLSHSYVGLIKEKPLMMLIGSTREFALMMPALVLRTLIFTIWKSNADDDPVRWISRLSMY